VYLVVAVTMQQCQILTMLIVVIAILMMEVNQIAWQKVESTVSAFAALLFEQMSS